MAIVIFLIAGCAGRQGVGRPGDWFEVVPPLDASGMADTSQPLTKWAVVGSFVNKIDCTTILESQQFEFQRWYGPIGNAQSYYEGIAVQRLNGRCVPRSQLNPPTHKHDESGKVL